MSEILFYCLERKTVEDILPGLLERTIERGWRAIVRVDSDERLRALDVHLWTYAEQSFLPHGTHETGYASQQPVYLTTGSENPNDATVLFIAAGEIPCDWPGPFEKFARVVVMFDGQNPANASAARHSWLAAQRAGHSAAMWRQNSSGKWEQQQPETT